MRFRDRRIQGVGELLKALKEDRKTKQPIWYRGHGQADWDLAPTIARVRGGITAESALITRFKQNALALLQDRPATEWEWLFVMRHHGVPTRLLDWSESPLVGLYFAVSETANGREDGVLWSLLPIELNKSANIRPQHPAEIPGFSEESILANYLPSGLAKEATSSLPPAAALAPRNTRRMQAQSGVFTITHREQIPIESVGDKKHVWRFIISARYKQKILLELLSLNINRLSMFPELDDVAAHAREAVG